MEAKAHLVRRFTLKQIFHGYVSLPDIPKVYNVGPPVDSQVGATSVILVCDTPRKI